jgi:hypothetical protein
MSKKRFILCILIWAVVLLLSASPAGEIPGYIFVAGIAFSVLPLVSIFKLLGFDLTSEVAQTIPFYFLGAAAGLILLFSLNFFRRAGMNYSQGDMDLARKFCAKGIQLIAIPSAIVLCIYSIGS